MLNSQNTNSRVQRGNAGDAVVNNNININKISINNFYNRQDPPQELYSVRSKHGTKQDRSTNEGRVKTDPSNRPETHKKNFSLNEQNLRGEQFSQLKK